MSRIKNRLHYVRQEARCLAPDCDWTHHSLYHQYPIRTSTTPDAAKKHSIKTEHPVEIVRAIRIRHLRPTPERVQAIQDAKVSTIV